MGIGIGIGIGGGRSRREDGLARVIATLFGESEPGLWLDPSDLSTVFTDTAGTTPAVVGDPVARINDKSGRGNHATQSVLASRPILRQDGGLHYLEFDGVDDGMSTGTITPGTDKAQVIAGVRKLAGDPGMIVESSTTTFGNNGSLRLTDNSQTSGQYAFVSSGTAISGVVASGFAPPRTDVVTGLGDISGDTATLRVGGVQVAQNTADQGTGNFLAYPLFIGSRNNNQLRFRGRIYSLVVRFGPNLDADRIALAEAYAAAKTGITL
jgi:hypothetical protein